MVVSPSDRIDGGLSPGFMSAAAGAGSAPGTGIQKTDWDALGTLKDSL
jgi:hypothetical protein